MRSHATLPIEGRFFILRRCSSMLREAWFMLRERPLHRIRSARRALHPYYDLAPTRIFPCICSEFFVGKRLEYSSLPSTPSTPRWVTT